MNKLNSMIGVVVGLVVLASVVQADYDGDGRDEWRYRMSGGTVTLPAFNTAATFRSNQLLWDDKGVGVWRTNDGAGNPVMGDKGYNAYDLTGLEDDGFDLCRIICEKSAQCKGVEYIAVATNIREGVRMFENGIEYNVNKCEIHYDDFYACDSSVSVAGGRGSMFNGCWVKIPVR